MTDTFDIQTLRVFRFVRDYIRQHGIAPSQREIAQGTFMATSSMIIYIIRLEMRGWLHREYNIPRSIRIGEYAPDDGAFQKLWELAIIEADEEGESP